MTTSTASDGECQLCDGSCTDADLTPLQAPALRWLFEQLAAIADHRGDAQLCTGRARLVVPDQSSDRAAARGLLGGSELRPGQRRTVDLAELSARLRVRGDHLTPGAAAAHILGRPLAERARTRANQHARTEQLHQVLIELHEAHPLGDVERSWAYLTRAGVITRLLAHPDPGGMLRASWAVLVSLPQPGSTADRRIVAQHAMGDPHALDLGAPLASLVLSLAAAVDLLDGTFRGRRAWQSLGVLGDDALGGLLVVGLAPAGWVVPLEALLGLTPRELARIHWPAPVGRGVVRVTENPSVLTAIADDVTRHGPADPVICTSGTPSGLEIAALDKLAATGWQLEVRADFDPMGLAHVRAMLTGISGATPWRMTTVDYYDSVEPASSRHGGLGALTEADTPWDPDLALAMSERGSPAYEEALLPELLADARGATTAPPQ